MGISEREHHIKTLEHLLSHYKARERCEGYYDSTLKDNVEALQYAISSLKTDLKYDLLYEGEDVYTKAEMITMVTELHQEIEKHKMTSGVTNQGTWNECIACCSRVIQEKINSLKENKDGNK